MNNRGILILVAEDDPDDRKLLKEALKENRLNNTLQFVETGEELMNYLHNSGNLTAKENYPLPGLILLDLNMPNKDGREALKEIKANPDLRLIPIVVFTTSKVDEDIVRTFDLGVSAYITKPVTFSALVDAIKTMNAFWFELVQLPEV